ncbi:MAG: hypothetical protein ABI218_13920 [Caldimonas sp.]
MRQLVTVGKLGHVPRVSSLSLLPWMNDEPAALLIFDKPAPEMNDCSPQSGGNAALTFECWPCPLHAEV